MKVNNYPLVNITFSTWVCVAGYFVTEHLCVAGYFIIKHFCVNNNSLCFQITISPGIYSVYKAIFKVLPS